MGVQTNFRSLKRGGGGTKFYPVLKRGGPQKVSDPQFSHFVAPLPVINDQSLILVGQLTPVTGNYQSTGLVVYWTTMILCELVGTVHCYFRKLSHITLWVGFAF